MKPYRPATRVAAQALTRLGLLLGETRYLDAAARTLRAAWSALQQYPHAHCSLLIALEEHLEPIDVVIVRGGDRKSPNGVTCSPGFTARHDWCLRFRRDATGLPQALADKKTAV